jgi:hypothetical protein
MEQTEADTTARESVQSQPTVPCFKAQCSKGPKRPEEAEVLDASEGEGSFCPSPPVVVLPSLSLSVCFCPCLCVPVPWLKPARGDPPDLLPWPNGS